MPNLGAKCIDFIIGSGLESRPRELRATMALKPPLLHIYEQMRVLSRTSNLIMLKIIRSLVWLSLLSTHIEHGTEIVIFNPTEVLWILWTPENGSYYIIANVNEIICWQIWASPSILGKYIDASHKHRTIRIACNAECRCSWKIICGFPNTHNSSRFHFYRSQMGFGEILESS